MDMKNFRGLSGTYNVRANERDLGTPHEIECLVQFLNNTQHLFVLDRRSKGQDLLNGVFKHLNLIETDFFGLKYLPQESQHQRQNHCNNANNNNNHAIPKNTIILTKTQSLNSYDHSPSSNVSLSSSSATNPASIINQQKLSNESSTVNNGTTTVSVANTNIGSNSSNNNNAIINNNNIIIKSNNLQQKSQNNDDSNICTFIEERWLDPTKSIRKQYKSNPPFKFYFRVKFYVSDPCKLADDTTRNHLYLQLRQDILNNRLIVPTCSAILLASYILQSEVGDYKRELLEEDYASNFQLLPNQSDDIKKKVIELHKTHKSLSAADAEYQFLEHAAKNLDCYGVEFYDAKDPCKTKVKIGVSSNGVVVFNDNKRTNQFSWAKIVKIMFKKKVFSIQLRQEAGENCDNFIEFNLLTNQACKSFWEECVAQHSFFRLHQPKSPPKKFFSFLNFGSRFQYNGKTEYQTMEESRKRNFSHFSRTPSKRYARRTVPIGRPSWSDPSSQASKKTSEEGYQNNNHEHNNSNSNDITKSANTHDSSCIFIAPVASRSVTSTNESINESLLNGSVDPRSAAYRPKSLTLKSFMYIDESKNVSALEHAHNSTTMHDCLTRPNDEIEIANHDNLDAATANSHRKDLKRSESLRIPSSIKGALSLTKKAGVTSSSQLARISESLRDKFLAGTKSKPRKSPKPKKKLTETIPGTLNDSDDLDTCSEMSLKVVRLLPGKDGKYGFKIREVSIRNSSFKASKSKKSKERSIIIYDVSPNSPAATCEPRLCEGDQLLTINGLSIEGLSESKVESLIKNIQHHKPPDLTLEVNHRYNIESASLDSSETDGNSRLSPISTSSNSKRLNQTLAASIKEIKRSLENKGLIKDFESLSRKKEDETLEESKLTENIDKNRYQDILPYDSTRVQLIDSMTGDYINASFVDMAVPSGIVNRYIATQGPLASTCDDFWQMVWEQRCSLIIMVTPLVEAGRVKCHKYWPDEKEDVRYGQILVRNLSEKSKTATIDRTIQLLDVKSGEKRIVSQIQYKAWPDHEVPADCSDFLKLVKRVRKHRLAKPKDPIVVHCSAGIGRTGVLILMETAICIMESGEPINPIKILEEMRKQRAMLIQTNSQFLFVAEAICKVYDRKLYKKSKSRK